MDAFAFVGPALKWMGCFVFVLGAIALMVAIAMSCGFARVTG